MDKVQQAYWDEYLAPKFNAFCEKIESHIKSSLQSPEDFEGVRNILEHWLTESEVDLLQHLLAESED